MAQPLDQTKIEHKRVGRPSATQRHNVSTSLLAVAKNKLNEKCHAEITAREIADLANINHAMIGYYYGCKDGLFSVLAETELKKIHSELVEFEEKIESIDGCPVRALISLLIKKFFGSANFSKIILNDIAKSDSLIRNRYVRKGSINYDQTKKIIQRFVDIGIFKKDTDVRLAVFMLVSFITTPLILSPVLYQYDLTMDELESDVWIDQLTGAMLHVYGA